MAAALILASAARADFLGTLNISLDETGGSSEIYTPDSGPPVTTMLSGSLVPGGGIGYFLGFGPLPGVVEITDSSGAISDVLDSWNTGSPFSGADNTRSA